MSLSIRNTIFDIIQSGAGYTLHEDIKSWVQWYGSEAWLNADPLCQDEETLADAACQLFISLPEFRSLFDYRIRSIDRSLVGWGQETFQRAGELHIGCESIGPRFRIQHGNGTWIFAKEIGSDFFIGHNVTVGSHRGIPRIGDRVMIRTGAVVVGQIEIGDDTTITANAVVTTDMPPNTVAYAPRTVISPKRAR